MNKVKELSAIRVSDQWLRVYMCGYDKLAKQSYYTVKAQDGSYVDIYEQEVMEYRYEEFDASEETLKLWKKAPRDDN